MGVHIAGHDVLTRHVHDVGGGWDGHLAAPPHRLDAVVLDEHHGVWDGWRKALAFGGRGHRDDGGAGQREHPLRFMARAVDLDGETRHRLVFFRQRPVIAVGFGFWRRRVWRLRRLGTDGSVATLSFAVVSVFGRVLCVFGLVRGFPGKVDGCQRPHVEVVANAPMHRGAVRAPGGFVHAHVRDAPERHGRTADARLHVRQVAVQRPRHIELVRVDGKDVAAIRRQHQLAGRHVVLGRIHPGALQAEVDAPIGAVETHRQERGLAPEGEQPGRTVEVDAVAFRAEVGALRVARRQNDLGGAAPRRQPHHVRAHRSAETPFALPPVIGGRAQRDDAFAIRRPNRLAVERGMVGQTLRRPAARRPHAPEVSALGSPSDIGQPPPIG